MGQTIIEKIFSEKLGRVSKAGEYVFADIDKCLSTDISLPSVLESFSKIKNKTILNKEKIIIIEDHLVPSKDIASANILNKVKNFVSKENIPNYYGFGTGGICHVVMPEEGMVKPGEIIIGTDSHTCSYGALGCFSTGVGSTDMAYAWSTGNLWFNIPESIRINLKGDLQKNVSGKDIILKVIGILGEQGAIYKALEFGGDSISQLSIDDRLTMCNMGIECGAKTALFPVDDLTIEYLTELSIHVDQKLYPDLDANYSKIIDVDLNTLKPQVSFPHSPSNVKEANELNDVKVDQIVIGSCTNGRFNDFKTVHEILKGKRINNDVKVLLIPGSQKVLKEIINQNLINDLIDAGCTISSPTCGPCIGLHTGILGENNVGLYTTNRNFRGRNGAKSSEVYLCSPATAAASAITGYITES